MNLFHLILLASVAHASNWFSSQPEYAKWSPAELRTWLEHRNIKAPPSFDQSHLYDLVDANWYDPPSPLAAYFEAGRQWSLDQYSQAQRASEHIRDDSFDKWDESKLKAFLLEQGIIAPSGPREQLVLLAKNKYRAYTDAAALHSSLASASASSVYTCATDAVHSASQCISSTVAQATHEVTRAFDDTKDYIYSTWDDQRLKKWLEDRGIVEAKKAKTRDELTRLVNDHYRKANSAAWESWSDSYIREWLIAHKLLRSTETPSRSGLVGEMKKYYYDVADDVWNTWSDSELKAWLVDHDFWKSGTERNRDELVKMVEGHYLSVLDIMWEAWMDSDIRQWLSEHGYFEDRNNVRNREDLVDLISNKHRDATEEVACYLKWPDARLRVYLRERGIGENALPITRPGLLRETRIRWAQTSTRAENIFARLREIINNSVEAAEEKVVRALESLSRHSHDIVRCAPNKDDYARECANMKKALAWNWGLHKVDEAQEKGKETRQFVQREGDEAAKRSDQARGGGDEL